MALLNFKFSTMSGHQYDNVRRCVVTQTGKTLTWHYDRNKADEYVIVVSGSTRMRVYRKQLHECIIGDFVPIDSKLREVFATSSYVFAVPDRGYSKVHSAATSIGDAISIAFTQIGVFDLKEVIVVNFAGGSTQKIEQVTLTKTTYTLEDCV